MFFLFFCFILGTKQIRQCRDPLSTEAVLLPLFFLSDGMFFLLLLVFFPPPPPVKTRNRKSIFLLPPFCFLNHLGLQKSPTASSPFVLKGSHFPLGPFVQTISQQNPTQCQMKTEPLDSHAAVPLFFSISLKLSSNKFPF